MPESPWSTLTPAEDTSDAPRRRKLQALSGLGGLAAFDNEAATPSEELSEQPLYGGAISKPSTISPEAGEPSQLATERVERAPASQEATPLLGGEERLGNVLTGEEGTYGPLGEEQRSVSLRQFFGPSAGSQRSQSAFRPAATVSGGDQGGDGIGAELGQARQALGLANTADRATGSNFDRALKDLFRGGGGFSGFQIPADAISGASGGSLAAGDIGQRFAMGDPSVTEFKVTPEMAAATADRLPPPGSAGAAVNQAGAVPDVPALGTAASLLGLITAIYNLQQGGEFKPGTMAGLASGAAGTTQGLGSLLGNPALYNIGGGAGAALSAATLPLSFGNAYNAFDADDPRAAAGGYGTLAGAGIGALVGALGGPVGAFAGAGAGAGLGGTVGNIIGSNLPKPHSMAVRQHGMEVATDAVNNYAWGIQQAGQNGDILGVQQALARGFDDATGVSLNLPRSVAAAIGVPPQAGIGDLSPDQFVMLLKAYREHDGVNQDWFTGTSQIPYLEHDDQGGKIVGAMTGIANNAMAVMARTYGQALDQMDPVAPLTWEDAGQGYRMAPQLDYNLLANDVGPRQLLSYEDARGYLGNTALRGGGVPLTASNPVGFGGGGDSVSMALRQLGQAPIERAPQMSPTEPFSTDWAGQRAGYQASLEDLYFQAQQQVADLYQQQIRQTQSGF